MDEYETTEKKVRLKLNKDDRAAFDYLVDEGEGGAFADSMLSQISITSTIALRISM